MLGAFRSKKNNPIILVLLGFVVILMAGFGVSFSSGSGGRWAARVNGEPIPYAAYSQAYRRAFRFRQQGNPGYDRTRSETENLRRQVIDELVNRKLLAQEAQKRGMKVDDETLRAELLSIPEFQVNNRFDPEAYERAIRSQGEHPLGFEASLREDILSQQLLGLIVGVGPSDAELRARWIEDQTSREAKFIKVLDSQFEDQVKEITEDDRATWRTSVDDSSAAIKAHYDRYLKSRYDLPKQVCARHILIKSPESTSEDDRKAHRTHIEEVNQKLTSNSLSFEDAAKTYSEDGSKSKGGDLGCFGPGQMVPKFEETAFKTAKGERSGIIQTRFGFHIMEVYDIKEAVMKSLEEVSADIEEELTKAMKTHRLAKTHAQKMLTAAIEAKSLEKALETMDDDDVELTVETTGPVTGTQFFVPKLGPIAPVKDHLWALTTEEPLSKEPLAIDDGWIFFAFVNANEPDEAKFAEQTRSLRLQLMFEKQRVVRERLATVLREQAAVELNPLAITYDDNLRRRAFGQ
ncbi:MAG: SurA N-terminal domain-containing protein [Myxococcales bacterium]|nr:SurA N-terminal domain-containing protein [Myxococcales bacterium]